MKIHAAPKFFKTIRTIVALLAAAVVAAMFLMI